MGKGEVLGAKGGDAGGGEVVNLCADFKTYKLVYWFSSGGVKGGGGGGGANSKGKKSMEV